MRHDAGGSNVTSGLAGNMVRRQFFTAAIVGYACRQSNGSFIVLWNVAVSGARFGVTAQKIS
jgi:hypothetical protein